MPVTIFIGGLLEYNSGKTTIAKDIISCFENDLSVKTSPFKPLSGNNLYFHYDLIKEHVDKFGNFVSLDIVELLSCSSIDLSQIIANPVHRVSTQALSYDFFKEGSINTFYSKYTGSVTLFQRFTICKQDSEVENIYLLNEPIYKNKKFWNDLLLTEPILKQANEIKFFKNEHEYYSLNSQFYADATKSSFENVKANSSVIVVESFNNSAHPAWCIREADLIFIVGPGSLFLYDPESYFRAIDNYRAINRNKPTATEEILKFATPKDAFSLPEDQMKRKTILLEILQSFYDRIK